MWKDLADLHAVVQLHMRASPVAQVESVAAEYPAIPILIDHLAYPDALEGPGFASYRPVLALARHANVYVKVSDVKNRSNQPFPFRDVHDVIRMVRDGFGPQRLLWGTGYPGHHRLKHAWLSLADELRLVREGFDFLSDAEKSAMLGDNAARIWSLVD
jgi:predicted TIM-barrel fold metal-dependent hydrolase